jgi:large subunit ribosomal protein L10
LEPLVSKVVKKLLSEELEKTLAGVDEFLILNVGKLGGIESNSMRLGLHEKSIRLRVVKNSLAKRLFRDRGWNSAGQLLEGPSAIAWGSPSIVELAKEITTWSEKLATIEIRGGATSGELLSASQVKDLSKMPSREELIGRVASLALAPAVRVMTLLNSPASRLKGQLASMEEAEDSSCE